MRAVGTLVLVGLAAGACSGEPTVGSIEAAVSSTAGATVTSASSVASTTPQTAGEVPPSSATSTSSTPVTTSTTEVDRTAPSLIVLSPEEGATFTQADVRFEGGAESGASVRAWDRWAATVAADGTWSIVLILEPGTNVARFTATDAAGNTEVAERVVRYDPPAPPRTTTIAPPTPPLTTVIVFYPTEVPEEHRPGSCSFHSVSTWREDAYRCGVDEDVLNCIYDPCFDTGDHVVCDVSPIRAGPGFILDLTEPLPVLSIPDGVNPWILEFPDGVVCESAPAPPEPLTVPDSSTPAPTGRGCCRTFARVRSGPATGSSSTASAHPSSSTTASLRSVGSGADPGIGQSIFGVAEAQPTVHGKPPDCRQDRYQQEGEQPRGGTGPADQ